MEICVNKVKSFIAKVALTALTAISVTSLPAQAQSVGTPDPDLVPFVDVSKYTGLWFEIASIPQSFQGFCQNTTAEYTLLDTQTISVANKCKVGVVPFSIYGTGKVVDTETNAVLEISFDNLTRKADYRIIALADDYSYALVTNLNRTSLFVLNRAPKMPESIFQDLLAKASQAGVDVSKVRKTKQDLLPSGMPLGE